MIMPLEASFSEKFTYYGVVPSRLWRYELIDQFDINSGLELAYEPNALWLLAIASWNDQTDVKVYNLTAGEMISHAILNIMEKHYVLLRNGTIFKVESNNPICVLLLNYQSIPLGNETSVPTPNTFYPAMDGSYVGKEFVLLASSDLQRRFMIFALEKSDIKIMDETGAIIKSPSLEPNSFERILLHPWHVYKIESTGHVMVQSGDPGGRGSYHYSFAVPSVQGGFVGTDFYTAAATTINEVEDYGFRVSAIKTADFKVYDLTTRQILFEAKVEAEDSVRFKVKADAIKVESSAPISLSFIHDGYFFRSSQWPDFGNWGYGAGVIFIGVKPKEYMPIYLPINSTCEAYIFAGGSARIEVDGTVMIADADKPILITQPGMHVIKSDGNIIIQAVHWPKIPENQGLEHPGTVVPCIETVHITRQISLTPLTEAFPLTNIIAIGAAVAVSVIAAWVAYIRRRKRSYAYK
ncbi:hypothetical protein KEJ34_04310 [Candidatus Bathyarchaeota archaeon]|nr:hypothetical protein [Candidatus Bathyarchaeota archaeon]